MTTPSLGPISGEIKVVLSIDDAKLKQFFGGGAGGGGGGGGGLGWGVLTKAEWMERRIESLRERLAGFGRYTPPETQRDELLQILRNTTIERRNAAMERRRESLRERVAGLGRYTPPETQRDELLQILAATNEERKNRQSLSRMFLRHIPLIGALAAGTAGIILLLGQILSHSQILSTFAKTYLRVFGAFVDILLIPFIPFLRFGLILFIKLFPLLFTLSAWLSKATDWMVKNPELAIIGTLAGTIIAGKLAELIANRFPIPGGPPTGRLPTGTPPTGKPPTGAPPVGTGAGGTAFLRWMPILGAAALTALIPGDVPRGMESRIRDQKRERERQAMEEWVESTRGDVWRYPLSPRTPLQPFEITPTREQRDRDITLQFTVQPRTQQELLQEVIDVLTGPVSYKAFENQWMGTR